MPRARLLLGEEAGFSLVEILASLVIGAFVLGIIAAGLRLMGETAARVDKGVVDQLAIARAAALLGDDALHALPLPEKTGAPGFSGDAYQVAFTITPRPPVENDQIATRVRYRVEAAPRGGTVVVRTTAPVLRDGRTGRFSAGEAVYRSRLRLAFRFSPGDGRWSGIFARNGGWPVAFGIGSATAAGSDAPLFAGGFLPLGARGGQ